MVAPALLALSAPDHPRPPGEPASHPAHPGPPAPPPGRGDGLPPRRGLGPLRRHPLRARLLAPVRALVGAIAGCTRSSTSTSSRRAACSCGWRSGSTCSPGASPIRPGCCSCCWRSRSTPSSASRCSRRDVHPLGADGLRRGRARLGVGPRGRPADRGRAALGAGRPDGPRARGPGPGAVDRGRRAPTSP